VGKGVCIGEGRIIVAEGVIAIVPLFVGVWAKWLKSRGGMVEGGEREVGEDVQLWIMGLYILQREGEERKEWREGVEEKGLKEESGEWVR
jgi:hypothetical protein